MERKIGEIFEYNGEWHQCLESNICRCDYCDYGELGDCHKIACASGERSDNKEVHFKKLEKIGEPYRRWLSPFNSIMVQRYRLYGRNVIMPGEPYMYFNAIYNTIEIELKQNKEDMEEFKMYDAKEDIPEFDKVVDECLFGKQELKLKPFDLQKAKEGKPVCTRDGRKVRIICCDFKRPNPIIALVENGNAEDILVYPLSGEYHNRVLPENDLFMLPEKRSGWVKIRKDINLYDTKEEADRKMIGNDEYVTAKVFWEE